METQGESGEIAALESEPDKAERELVGGLDPAASIVSRLGGPSAVAREVGLHRTRVSAWKLPKVNGGTGGLIPPKHIPALMRLAARLVVPLRYEEFFVQDQRELDLDWIDPTGSEPPHLTHDGPELCHCVKVQQDESCPVGFPSLVCEDCNGTGIKVAKFGGKS